MRKKLQDGIYGNRVKEGNELLLFRKATVNGKLCAAFVKNDELIAYLPFEEIQKIMFSTTQCLEFHV